MQIIFKPLTTKEITFKNRVVMAPMTRSRADDDGVPSPLAARYYSQRSSAGLIITEGTQISAQGRGYIRTPGIHTEEQVRAWNLITDAVHEKDGVIFLQLAHAGSISHPELQPNNALPIAPSAVRPTGFSYTETGPKEHLVPRPLSESEIPDLVTQYKIATHNAMRAGFDGVEIHSGNGYLLDQFLRNSTNKRSDKYGGSIENRCRLTLEVVQAVSSIIGASRTGVRISPMSSMMGGISDSDPQPLYNHLAEQLSGILYLHVVESLPEESRKFDYEQLRKKFTGVYIANNGYDLERAESSLSLGSSDMISFGKPFIANPDLVYKLSHNLPLTEADMKKAYSGGEEGYTDYPLIE